MISQNQTLYIKAWVQRPLDHFIQNELRNLLASDSIFAYGHQQLQVTQIVVQEPTMHMHRWAKYPGRWGGGFT